MSTKIYPKLSLFSVLVTALSAAVAPIGSTAPDFTIKDQYDHEIQLLSQRGKAVLLIYGDNAGSDYMGAWAAAVRDSAAAPSVNVIRIANLRAVPSLLRSYVKRQFLKPHSDGKPTLPVLLDWDAAVARIYGFTDDLTNVYLIDEQGMLRYRACGKGTPEETRKLLDMIANLRQ
jgi:AhpC/TSA family